VTATVDIWRVALETTRTHAECYRKLLCQEERQRAGRFRREVDQLRFIVSRAALRTILGNLLGAPANELQFRYGVAGKPEMATPAARDAVFFNVSHAHDLAAIAVTRHHTLGIDVEYPRRDGMIMDIAERFFSPLEFQALQGLPSQDRTTAFYRCWTRKEAYLKALGTGLSKSLESFDVSLTAAGGAELLADRGDPSAPERWSLCDLEVPSPYLGTLAIEARGVSCRYHDFESN